MCQSSCRALFSGLFSICWLFEEATFEFELGSPLPQISSPLVQPKYPNNNNNKAMHRCREPTEQDILEGKK
jgi:hypothetical protein